MILGNLIKAFLQIFSKKQHKQIIQENNSFSACFSKLLDDLSDSCKLLEELLLDDRLIENFIIYQEARKKLIFTFQTKIDHINFDIKLIQSKLKRDEISNIKAKNKQINNLLINIISIEYVLFNNTKDEKEKEQVKPLFDEVKNGLDVLEEVISENNQRSGQNKSKILITIKEARENAIQVFEAILDYAESCILEEDDDKRR